MSEDVYAKPDLTKKVRYRPRDREGETEDRGDWEERTVDIYVTADNPDPNPDRNPGPKPDPKPPPNPPPNPDPNPDPGTEQDAARNNTAQQQRGASKESKQNLYVAVVVVACGLLLLAGIIVLLILYGALIKEKHILQSSLDQLQNRHDNLTDHFDKLETRFTNMTDQRDQWKTRFDNMTDQRDQLQTELTKRILCESHGFTFGGDWCYYYSTELKTWEDSRAFCTARKSDLMTMKSREKQDFVVKLVGEGKSVWFGLTDSETEGVWKWVDRTPLTTKPYWGPGQPDDDGEGEEEDCVMFYNGGWDDIPCGWPNYCMCEIVF